MTAAVDGECDLLELVHTGDWLDAQTFPPLRWAVHGLIPQGFGLFTGPPKAGKSWAALSIGLAVAGGTNALGKVPTGRPRPTLYLALEDGDSRLQWRARTLLGEGTPIPAQLHTVTRALPNQVLPLIRAWLEEHGHADPLVMLDTLGRVMPPALPGEGAYQRDYRIGSRLKELSDGHPGSSLLVVHHIRKATGEDWMDSTSGTNGLNGAADFTLNLSRSRNADSGVLRVTGRDVAECEYAITSSEGSWTLDGLTLAEAAATAVAARAVEDLGDRSAEVFTLVASRPETRAADVVAACGIDVSQARVYLSRLADAGRVARPSRGVYAPVTSVASVTSEGEDPSGGNTRNTHNSGTGDPVVCLDCGFPLAATLEAQGIRYHVACGAA